MFSWIFCDIFKNCFFNKTLLGLLPLSLSRIIKAESKQELQQIQEKILRVIPISVVKHLHRIKYSPNQFSLKLYVKWECQNSFVTLIVTLYPTLHKNKVLYRGFLQHMWPNPQFPSDLVTCTEEILNGKLHFFAAWCVAVCHTGIYGLE